MAYISVKINVFAGKTYVISLPDSGSVWGKKGTEPSWNRMDVLSVWWQNITEEIQADSAGLAQNYEDAEVM